MGSRCAGVGGRTARGRVVGHEPVEQREPVEAAHGDDGPRRRRRATAAGGSASPSRSAARNAGDVGSVTSPRSAHARAGQELDVAAQVAAVGRERVGRQPALDRQVVEVAGDDPVDGGRTRPRAHGLAARSGTSTSASGTDGHARAPRRPGVGRAGRRGC